MVLRSRRPWNFRCRDCLEKDKADISPEGVLMMAKFCERIRELGLTKMHLRIAGEDSNLSAQRETALAEAMEKALVLASRVHRA